MPPLERLFPTRHYDEATVRSVMVRPWGGAQVAGYARDLMLAGERDAERPWGGAQVAGYAPRMAPNSHSATPATTQAPPICARVGE